MPRAPERPAPTQDTGKPAVTGPSPAGLAERLAARRRRTRTRLAVLLGIPVLLLALLATAWFSPLLALQEVAVSGSELVPAETVSQEVLAEHSGTPLPRLRSSTVAGTVLENHPELAAAEVSWAGPRKLRVTLRDRIPVLALDQAGTIALVDTEAVVVRTTTDYPEDLARLELTRDVDQAERKRIVASALHLLGPLSEAERGTISALRADHPERLNATVRVDEAQVTVVFGDGSRAREKYRLATQLAATGAKRIDVSVPAVPVTD